MIPQIHALEERIKTHTGGTLKVYTEDTGLMIEVAPSEYVEVQWEEVDDTRYEYVPAHYAIAVVKYDASHGQTSATQVGEVYEPDAALALIRYVITLAGV